MMFRSCTSLKSITIPDSVTSIATSAFYNCSALESIIIGNGVTRIGDEAFDCCDKLMDVYYNGTKEQWDAIYVGSENYPLERATIHYNYAETTPDTYEISGLQPTDSGVSFTVRTMEAVSGKQAAIIACYDENGVFLGLQEKQITAFPDGQERQDVSFDIDKEHTSTVKAFVWNAMEYMMPASHTKTLKLK